MRTLLEAEFGLSSDELAQRLGDTLGERQGGALPFVRTKGVDNSVPTFCVVTADKMRCARLIHAIVKIPRLNVEYLSELLYTPEERRGVLMNEYRREIREALGGHRISGMRDAGDGQTVVTFDGGEMTVSRAVLDEFAVVWGDLKGDA